ncbi:hypothetical protein J6590_054780 [Homalodisca vitripennis]|nr:hypothetical protein J6590_054780 [Homalodisca vitripennis]
MILNSYTLDVRLARRQVVALRGTASIHPSRAPLPRISGRTIGRPGQQQSASKWLTTKVHKQSAPRLLITSADKAKPTIDQLIITRVGPGHRPITGPAGLF